MVEEQSEHNIEFVTNGHNAYGYLEKPASGSGPGVIVIQEWWGLTTHIADLTRRLAAEGFVALAPDLYGNRATHDREDAMRMRQQLDTVEASQILSGAVDHLIGLDEVTSSTVGAIGFCMGGGFVLSLAAEVGPKVSAAVPFYGFSQDVKLDKITADVQGHYGRADQSIPVATAEEAFARLGRRPSGQAELFLYDAGHAFLNDENLIGTYDPENARLAWGRAVAFLREKVR